MADRPQPVQAPGNVLTPGAEADERQVQFSLLSGHDRDATIITYLTAQLQAKLDRRPAFRVVR
jgi:hypothetical protein